MQVKFARNTVIVILVASIGMAGCVTTGSNQPQADASASDSGCNPGLAALGGALIGGLLTSGNNRVRGAAIGAGLASLACVAWNYNAKQTKTAEQVRQEYKVANKGAVPTESQVMRYETNFDPSNKVTPGKRFALTSNIDVIQGSADKNPVVEEELTLADPNGKDIKSSRKRANDGQGAGGYQTNFSMNLPDGVPQGDYLVKTALYLNGKKVNNRDMTLQVVALQTGEMIAMLK